jgi:NAD-dependent dihydropyrimidine dehydrogenase PreA subunit
MVNDKAVVDVDTCIDCGVCIDACPAEAISME